jgi:pyridinium-3,5-bisthiocarboxylic acid mononucleotide nickel chelatase
LKAGGFSGFFVRFKLVHGQIVPLMKILYLDIFSGISGDMLLGALIDLGIDFQTLERELKKIDVEGYHLHVSRESRSSIAGVKFNVHLTHEPHSPSEAPNHADEHSSQEHAPGHSHEHPHTHHHDHHHHDHAHGQNQMGTHAHQEHHHPEERDFKSIQQLIEGSGFSQWVKEKSLAVFKRIAVAEGKVHGCPPEEVHFHEVGAIDSIVDIVGSCLALEMLGRPKVMAAPVIEGSGWVQCAHGRFPVPTTATLEILGARGIPMTQCDEPHELVTPTGAALLAEFVEYFGPMQRLVATKIGYGLGTRENRTRPNVLRAVLGEIRSTTGAETKQHDWEMDTIAVLETNLDDLNPEILGNFIEKALASGALDIFHTPVQMKKNRPGILLTLLCPVSEQEKFLELILRETSAFGVRFHAIERRKLKREWMQSATRFGAVRMKIGKLDGETVQMSPEFESCKELAERLNVPLKTIYEEAIKNQV